jgi:hypothetical protein
MCSNGQFTEPQQCALSRQCFALPLVNSKGTSVTCDTETDAADRIAATGATGGIDGSGSAAAPSSSPAATPSKGSAAKKNVASIAPSTASSTSSPSSDFQLQNGKDAQQLNAMFATLAAGSSCSTGTHPPVTRKRVFN